MAVDKLVDSTQLDADLASVADAIRAKGGTSAQLAFPSEFVSAIGDISTGGGGLEQKQINFIDYDGTLLHSYSKEEFSQLTDLPENPSHTGLTSQGWNWTKQQITAQITALPDSPVWIGQMYITTSGKTEIDVTLQDPDLSPYLILAVNGTVIVDWGDGSSTDTVTGTSLTSSIFTQHVYSSEGSYTISIEVSSGSFTFFNDNASSTALLGLMSGRRATVVYAKNVNSIRLGSGITSFMDSGLCRVIGLETITIPSSVTSIGTYTFSNCWKLKSITLPSTLTSITDHAFYECHVLESVSLPGGLTSILGAGAFNNCYALESVTIPYGVTGDISTALFYNCFVLKSVAFPNGITSIGGNAFYNCYAIKSVIFSNNMTSMGTYIFNNCYALESVVLPSSLQAISNYAFQACYRLKSITIPSSVTNIGNYAFNNCQALKSITIPSTASNITGQNIFASCASLMSVTIENGITAIPSYAFYSCSGITHLTIPSSVTSIGNNAFNGCTGMLEYHFLPATPPTLSGYAVFSGMPTGTIIYVPYSADHSILNAYKTAANWTSVASYIQEEPQ